MCLCGCGELSWFLIDVGGLNPSTGSTTVWAGVLGCIQLLLNMSLPWSQQEAFPYGPYFKLFLEFLPQLPSMMDYKLKQTSFSPKFALVMVLLTVAENELRTCEWGIGVEWSIGTAGLPMRCPGLFPSWWQDWGLSTFQCLWLDHLWYVWLQPKPGHEPMSLMGMFAPSWSETLLSGDPSPTYMTGFCLLFFLNTQTKKIKVSADATWLIHSRQNIILHCFMSCCSQCPLVF